MMQSYEYTQFLIEKIMQYLPQPYVRVGDKINCRCMVCGDSKKSATKKRGWIYMQNASYYCFNCGVSMSGIQLVKLLSGTDYDSIHREYVRLFLKSGHDSSLSAAIWKPKVDDEPSVFNIKPILDPQLKKPLSDKAKEYLSKRKVLEAPFLKETLFSTYATDGSPTPPRCFTPSNSTFSVQREDPPGEGDAGIPLNASGHHRNRSRNPLRCEAGRRIWRQGG